MESASLHGGSTSPRSLTGTRSVFLKLTSTMSVAYALEKQVAISAVLRACSLTSSVFNKLVKNETVTKDDKSPVTGPSFVEGG